MTVINPADDVSAQAAVEAALKINGPVYLRFGRAPVPVLYDRKNYKFEIGKGYVLADGKDITIVATGITVFMSLQAREMLKADGIDAAVIDMPTIKPIDSKIITEYAKKTGKIITAEEHSIIGGLGSAVCEVVAENYPVPVKRVGVNDTFGTSGKAFEVAEQYGISANNIYEQAKILIKQNT